MTAINWANGVTGNWNDKTKWEFGAVPTSTDDVTVNNAGAFTIAVSTADVANSLTFDSANAILSESTTGSLKITGALNLEAGTVVLRRPNAVGSVDMTGGVMLLYAGNALGSAAVTLDGGEFTGMVNEGVNNTLEMGGTGATIDAATGTTLDLDSPGWSLDTTSSPTLQFGSASRKGVVEWHTNNGSILTGTLLHGVRRRRRHAEGRRRPPFHLPYREQHASVTVAAGAAARSQRLFRLASRTCLGAERSSTPERRRRSPSAAVTSPG